MMGGNICTRCCKFCNTQTGKPLPLDMEEPTHDGGIHSLDETIPCCHHFRRRDDLRISAAHWACTIREIKRLNPETTIEVLIPDFQGRKDCIPGY